MKQADNERNTDTEWAEVLSGCRLRRHLVQSLCDVMDAMLRVCFWADGSSFSLGLGPRRVRSYQFSLPLQVGFSTIQRKSGGHWI